MKRFYHWGLAALFLAGLVAFLAERGKVAALRQENKQLHEDWGAAQHRDGVRAREADGQREEMERLRTEAREVHELRNEVGQLRASAKEADRLRLENQQLRAANQQVRAPPKTSATAPATSEGFFARENWAFTGYSTPEAALQSAVWAMREGDTRSFLASLAPEEMVRVQKEWGNKSEAEVSAVVKRDADKISSIRILESTPISDDEVVLSVYAAGGEDHVQKVSFKRVGAEWKVAGPKKD